MKEKIKKAIETQISTGVHFEDTFITKLTTAIYAAIQSDISPDGILHAIDCANRTGSSTEFRCGLERAKEAVLECLGGKASPTKPLPDRERMIEIAESEIIFGETIDSGRAANMCAVKIVDALLHDGQIEIGDGQVDPKSETTVYYVSDNPDTLRLSEYPAYMRAFDSLDNSRFFLQKSHAEAFLAAELAKLHKNKKWVTRHKKLGWYTTNTTGRPDKDIKNAKIYDTPQIPDFDYDNWEWVMIDDPHKDEIEIGNKKWVKKGTMGLYQAFIYDPKHICVAKTLDLIERFSKDQRDRIFTSESEAEDQLRKDGFVKIGGGEWVKDGTKCWYVTISKSGIALSQINKTDGNPERHFTNLVKAAEFLDAELAKGL